MTKSAAEFIEPLRLGLLIGRALVRGHLRDQVHRRQRADAAFKAVSQLFSFRGESQFSVISGRVAAFAAMIIEYVLGHFFLALAGGSHFVEVGDRDLGRLLLLRKKESEENGRGGEGNG